MNKHPHSEDLYKRETVDNGFSKGWGMHFKPVADYFFDAHTHYHERYFPGGDISDALSSTIEQMDELGIKKAMILFKVYDNGWQPEEGNLGPFFKIDEIIKHKDFFNSQDRFLWAPYLRYKDPNLDIINKSIKAGASLIKLHNAHIIIDGASPDVWLSCEWQKVFCEIEKNALPVMWHVTQRRTECKYRGMGAESYWKDGVKKGITYSNEELLQVFLKVVEKYPSINFIGAHQLHIGWERLGELFDKYPNLYTDTSTGCFLNPDDDFYPEDKEYLRNFFIKYQDRIMFATDIYYEKGIETNKKFIFENKGHIRFVNKLELPEDILQKIAYKNAERLYKCKNCLK